MYYRNKRNRTDRTHMFGLILSWRRTTHVLVSYHGLSNRTDSTNMFDLILSWRRTTHVLVSYHGLSTLSTTETNVIGQTVQICLI